MRVSLAAAAVLFAMAWGTQPAVAQKSIAPTLEMSADGEVQIAPDGSVSDYRLQSKLSPAIADLVDKDVRRWQFQPILVDGKAVVAKTAMHLELKAEPADGKDNYRIRVTEVRFGELRRAARMRPPHYPKEAVIAHLGAKVLLAVRLDETGKVLDVQPYQTSLDARASSENEAERWRKMFEQASMTAARTWQWNMSETINGKTVGASVIVPIAFTVRDVGKPEPTGWRALIPGPVHPAPWMNSTTLADSSDLSSLKDDETVSLDSKFRLKDSVVGKTL